MPQTLAAKTAREHVAKARQAKRASAEEIGIDAHFISEMVERFYTSIRADDLLGPIFAERIGNWPVHLERMKLFWRSVLHNSGEFSGNPMARHIAIPDLEEAHFSRWLQLFYANLHSMNAGPQAVSLVGERARMIAESLLAGIATHRNGIACANQGRNLPHV